jgi:hypothetical protein
MPYRRIPPKKWPARDEVTKLARQHTVEAMEKLVGLMQRSRSEFVQMTAARTVLLQSEPGSLRSLRFGRIKPGKPEEVTVKIARFEGEKNRGTEQRDRELPVVQGGREGPREPGDADDTRLPEVRRKRTGIRDEP